MAEHTRLNGKRVLVTGGTTGIGRETIRLLTEQGARVITFGRDAQALQEALDYAPGSTGLTADAATREGIELVFGEVDRQFGGIDVLVACAALGAQPIHEMAEDDWRYVVDTNLNGYLAAARQAVLRMKRAGGGHILFVSSISIDVKKPGESVYAATKAGIQAFAETLRKEVADSDIKVSVIQPGSVATDMQQCSEEEKRAAVARDEMLHAVEVAEAIVFVLTRSKRAEVINLRIEPRMQKTA